MADDAETAVAGRAAAAAAAAAKTAAAPKPLLTEYEQQRAAQISRNAAHAASLGVTGAASHLSAVAATARGGKAGATKKPAPRPLSARAAAAAAAKAAAAAEDEDGSDEEGSSGSDSGS